MWTLIVGLPTFFIIKLAPKTLICFPVNQTKNKYTRWVKKLGLLFIWPIKIKCLQLLSIKHHNFSGYVSAWAWVIDSTKYFGLEAMLIGHTIFMSSASRVFFFFLGLSNPILLDWATKDYTISKASAKQHQNTKKQMDERPLSISAIRIKDPF